MGKAGPLVVARFISACITVCIPLVLARVMSLSEYGTYKQIFLVSQTLYYVLPFGVAQSLYFFVPRVENPRTYFGQTLIYLLVAGAVAGLALFLLGPLIAAMLNNPGLLEHRLELALYCGCAIGSFPLELSMTSQGKTRQSAITYLVSDSLRASALTVPVLLGFGLHGMMTGMVLWALARLAAAWALMAGRGTGPLWDARLFWRQLVYAAPFGAAILFSIPQQYAHQFMVSSTVSPALFALYAVGCFQLPLVDLLYTPTSEVLMVRIGELEKSGQLREAAAAFREASARLAYAFLPLAAFLFAAAPEFIAAVFGEKFLAAVPIFRICLVGIPLAVLPMDGTLRARNLTRHIFLSYVLKAAVTVPLVYFGVNRFGMIGGISAWAIAELVGKGTLLAKVPAALSDPAAGVELRLRDVLPWPQLGKATIAAAAAALGVVGLRTVSGTAFVGLPHSFLFRIVPLAVAGLMFGFGYLAVLWMSGVRPASVVTGLMRRRTA